MEIKEKQYGKITGIQATQFGIQSSAKAFDLIAGLYQDPIKAIVREIGTNCYDAHKEAGHTKDFDVCIPENGASNTTVYWRDYGLGMSPEKIKNVYTIVYGSDKTGTNNQAGCFGLGSKSPFNYVDEIQVDTWNAGTHYSYLIFKDAQGIPSYTLLSERVSDEPSGTKISFKINSKDISNFAHSARDVYTYFKDIKPNFVKQDIKISSVEYTLRKNFWGIKKNGGGAKFIMGPVAYLSESGLLDYGNKHKFSQDQLNFLRSCSFDFYFDIGELDIPPNREYIKLTDNSINKIKLKINECLKDLGKECNKLIEDASDLWEARKKWNTLDDFLSRIARNTVEFQGKKIFNSDFAQTHYGSKGSLNIRSNADFKSKIFSVNLGKKDHIHSIIPQSGIVFVLNDMKRGALVRCKYNHELTGDRYYLVDPSIAKSFARFIGTDVSIYKKASELDYEITKTSRSNGRTYKISKLNLSSYTPSAAWAETSHDVSKGGYYIELFRYHGLHKDKKYELDKIKKLINYYNKHNTSNVIDHVYGIKTNFLEKALKSGGKKWINIVDLCKSYFDANKNNKFKFSTDSNSNWRYEKRLLDYCSLDDVKKLIEETKKLYKNDDYYKYLELNSIADIFEEKLSKQTSINYDDIIEEKLDRYPLIDFKKNFNSFNKEELAHIKLYIDTVNKQG